MVGLLELDITISAEIQPRSDDAIITRRYSIKNGTTDSADFTRYEIWWRVNSDVRNVTAEDASGNPLNAQTRQADSSRQVVVEFDKLIAPGEQWDFSTTYEHPRYVVELVDGWRAMNTTFSQAQLAPRNHEVDVADYVQISFRIAIPDERKMILGVRNPLKDIGHMTLPTAARHPTRDTREYRWDWAPRFGDRTPEIWFMTRVTFSERLRRALQALRLVSARP